MHKHRERELVTWKSNVQIDVNNTPVTPDARKPITQHRVNKHVNRTLDDDAMSSLEASESYDRQLPAAPSFPTQHNGGQNGDSTGEDSSPEGRRMDIPRYILFMVN